MIVVLRPRYEMADSYAHFGPLEWVVLLAMVALIVLVVRRIASFVVRETARKQASVQDESRAPEEGVTAAAPDGRGRESR
jgi:hypothetical protein